MQFDKNTVFTLILMAAAIVVIKFMPRVLAGVPFVKARDLHGMMNSGKEVVVIDVRTPREYNGPGGHIEGSINVLYPDLKERLAQNENALSELKDQAIFVTCQTENRSPRMAKMLKKAGFTNVHVLAGGMRGWQRERLPVVGSHMR